MLADRGLAFFRNVAMNSYNEPRDMPYKTKTSGRLTSIFEKLGVSTACPKSEMETDDLYSDSSNEPLSLSPLNIVMPQLQA